MLMTGSGKAARVHYLPGTFRLLSDGVVPSGYQRAVDDEDGVLTEPPAWLHGEHLPEMVDDSVGGRLGDHEEPCQLAHSQVRAPVRRDQQNAVLQ